MYIAWGHPDVCGCALNANGTGDQNSLKSKATEWRNTKYPRAKGSKAKQPSWRELAWEAREMRRAAREAAQAGVMSDAAVQAQQAAQQAAAV